MNSPTVSRRDFLKTAALASAASNVAVRARRRIEWDAKSMTVTNLPEANQYTTKAYRPGFGV